MPAKHTYIVTAKAIDLMPETRIMIADDGLPYVCVYMPEIGWVTMQPYGWDNTPKPVITTRYKKGNIPANLRWQVWERDNFTCRQCGCRTHLVADHVIPESRGGPTTIDNLQTLCYHCNAVKGRGKRTEAQHGKTKA